jgi:hypothetical protein
MLQKELLGQAYSKTEYRRSLLPQLQARCEGSVESKHQDVVVESPGRSPRHLTRNIIPGLNGRHEGQSATGPERPSRN